MSTKTELNPKYVAHGEKSKLFIFRSEIAIGDPRSVVGLFLQIFLRLVKTSKKLITAPRDLKNTQNG